MATDLMGHWADENGAHHEWPAHGSEVTLPDDLADEVIRLGHAVKVRPPQHAKAVAADPVKKVVDKA
jgi:hypothetical protein